MSAEQLSEDLVVELREALASGKGNYGHRLLCGKAADEIESLRVMIRVKDADYQRLRAVLDGAHI